MRLNARLVIFLPPLFCVLAGISSLAWAAPLRLTGADPRSVTLHLEVGDPAFSKPDARGRTRIQVVGLDEAVLTGRPVLPMASAVIAIPPGSRVTAHVIGAEAERLDDNVTLDLGPKAGFRGDGGPLGTVPMLEEVPPILDGPWPAAPVEVSQPFTIRHQHVVTVRVWPFRYDAATRRLWTRRSITVRLDFEGGRFQSGLGAEDDGAFEPVLRGTVLNYNQGKSWRQPGGRIDAESAPRPGIASGLAFDEDELEVRVQLDTTGVYALDFDELAAHGYPAAVPDSEVSVHRHEYIQDPPAAGPAYATIELPSEVDDNDGDGRFGSGDRILVYVQSWADRSRVGVGQRAWGDGDVVYVTRLSGRAGRRVPTRPGWRDLGLAPLASYPWTQRFEKNNFYIPVFQPNVTDTATTDQFLWVPSGTFGSPVQLYTEPDSFRFETNDLDTSRTVQFSVNWRGTRNNGHLSWAHVRNAASRITSIVDSTSWFGRGSITRTTTLFGSALSEGDRNVLRAWGRTNPCPDPVDCGRVNAVNDWFQVTYWRRFNALGGYLSCNNGGASGDYEIRATGFGFRDDIRVYDVTDSLNPTRLALHDSLVTGANYPWGIKFQDNAPLNAYRRYVVVDNPRRPAPERYTSVTRRQLAERPADYLIIVPEVFLDEADRLRVLREAQGHSVLVAPLEAVNDEFNGGRKSPWAIKRFLRHAYLNWNAHFVLLVGDACEDPQRFTPTSTPDWIPVHKVAAPVPVSDGYSSIHEAIPSDPWYVFCLDCPSYDAQPKLHDMFIGRLPVNSVEQARGVIDKLIAYENVRPEDSWRREMVLLADDAYSTVSTFGGGNPGDPFYCYRSYEEIFLEISQAIRDSILIAAGLTRSDPYVFDLGDSLANEDPDPGNPNCRLSWPGTQQSTRLSVTPKLLALLNAGKLWWNYQGHANPRVITHESIYVNNQTDDDKDRLVNVGKPFFFSGFSCHPNFFSGIDEGNPRFGPSLGEDMVMLPAAGAIASWASSGFEIIPFRATTHLNVHLARALFWHAAFDTTWREYWNGQVQLGEAVAKALIDNNRTIPNSLERDVGISYNLLGNPGTRISTGVSNITVTANGQDVVDGEPVRLVTLADTLRLEIDVASNTRFRALILERSDGSGSTVIPPTEYTITPAFPDTARLGNAGRRYHISYFTTLSQDAYRYTIRTIDENLVASKFDVVFRFFTVLRADGVPVADNDPVRPDARLELLVISPRPIVDAQAEFELLINGVPVPFLATNAPGDPSGREWVITWNHGAYPVGTYRIELQVAGQFTLTANFRVETRTALKNVLAFPNPFDEELGTSFSFTLEGDAAANLLIRVYTVSGKLIYDRTEPGVFPGYHQLAWNGEDAEGDKIANGVYLYRILVRTPSGSAKYEGRLVKLRKPVRRAEFEP